MHKVHRNINIMTYDIFCLILTFNDIASLRFYYIILKQVLILIVYYIIVFNQYLLILLLSKQ